MPVCNKCGEEKAQEEFSKDKKSKTGYSYRCKKCNYKQSRNWVLEHKERARLYQDKYREDHKVELQEYHIQYSIDNKEKRSICSKKYRMQNKELLAKKASIYWLANKDKIKVYKQQWAKENKDRLREKRRNNYLKNRDQVIKQTTAYHLNKLKVDVAYRILCNARRQMVFALHNNKKADHTVALLGCSPNELREWLEKQFTDDMSWDNYGKSGIGLHTWQVDHRQPLASFDLSDPEQQRRAFHYTNLQPLWWWDNAHKSDAWNEKLEA